MAARIHKGFFTKVRVARELLREKAEDILNEYLDVMKKASDAGDYETASKGYQWLIEHMPEDDEGKRMIDGHVDKAKQIEAPSGPRVQIGIQVGGVQQPKALPVVTSETIND